ncbi:uncharacterized protein LOC144129502 [Amblyomma americanum]
MPACCCVPFCSQRGVRDAHGNKVCIQSSERMKQLHACSFSSKKWIVAIRRDERKEFRINKHTKVYSKHFANDKGFKVEEMLETINVALNNPPFLRRVSAGATI